MATNAKAPIVVVGAGYVGLTTALNFAQARRVRLVDRDQELIDELACGTTRIREDGLQVRLARELKQFSFYTSLDDALADGFPRLVIVAVGTPTRDGNGEGSGEAADLDAVHETIDVLLEYPGIAAVMKSTVPPGTGRATLERAREIGNDLVYVSCPEFVQEGEAFDCFERPDRIVVGREAESWATAELRELHAKVHPGTDLRGRPTYLEMDITSAELVKHASNLHLATRISYANQLANLCEELDADVTTVMAGVGADTRIGPEFLHAGVGFGGSCFGKDLRALRHTARAVDVELSLVDTVLSINTRQVGRAIGKLERRLGTLKDRHVALLGLAFKSGTADLRGSPTFALADALRLRGATLRAWDPQPDARARAVENWNKARATERMPPEEIATCSLHAMTDAHAVVLITAWPEFREIDWSEAARVLAGTLVVDGRNQLDPDVVSAAGLEYDGTGRHSHGLTRPLLESAAE